MSTPHCAVHPEVVARPTPCERCGNFACEPCFGSIDSELCASCRARAAPVPWEDPKRGFFDRFVATVQACLLEPRATFRSIGPGELGPSATFSLLALAVGYSPLLVCMPCLALVLGISLLDDPTFSGPFGELGPGVLAGMVVAMPVWTVIVHGMAVLFYLVVFHAAARLLGGTGTVSASLRAVLYTNAIQPINALLMLVAFIPFVGSLFQLAGLAFKLVWTGFALTGTAERVHGLTGERALLAAHLPGAIAALLFVSAIVLSVGMMFAMMPSMD